MVCRIGWEDITAAGQVARCELCSHHTQHSGQPKKQSHFVGHYCCVWAHAVTGKRSDGWGDEPTTESHWRQRSPIGGGGGSAQSVGLSAAADGNLDWWWLEEMHGPAQSYADDQRGTTDRQGCSSENTSDAIVLHTPPSLVSLFYLTSLHKCVCVCVCARKRVRSMMEQTSRSSLISSYDKSNKEKTGCSCCCSIATYLCVSSACVIDSIVALVQAQVNWKTNN